jgi:nickel transport system substrate-binding protein
MAPGNDTRVKNGTPLVLEFIFVEDDATKKALEDDIRVDLAKLGIKAVAVPLDKEEWNERATAGDFHLAFATTWGAPYDPHSFASSWRAPNEGDFAAQQGALIQVACDACCMLHAQAFLPRDRLFY